MDQTGYTARLPRPARAADEAAPDGAAPDEAGGLRTRLLISLVLAVPAAAMALSSVFVVSNSLRLRRFSTTR